MAREKPFETDLPPEKGGEAVSVIVYTLPLCARSIATIRDLAHRGVTFAEVDLSQDAAARARVQALGYMRAPVVVAGPEHWAGYNPQAISRIAAKKPGLRVSAGLRAVDATVTWR